MQGAGLEIHLYTVFHSRHAGLLSTGGSRVTPMGLFSMYICASRLITAGAGEASYEPESRSCTLH